MPTELARLEAELGLLELEVATFAELVNADLAVPGHRQPFPHEIRAGVRFAALDRAVDDAAQLLTRHAGRVREAVLNALGELVGSLPPDATPAEAVRRLQALTDPLDRATLPGVADLVDEVTATIEADLTRVAHAGAGTVLDEARAQGLDPAGLPDTATLDPAAGDTLGTLARQVATQPLNRLLTVAVDGGLRAVPQASTAGEVILGALDAAEQASTAGLDDVARQAASSAQGIGRTAAAQLTPTPASVYASELLDRRTCEPCGHVDGRTYDSLAHALEDYPGAGGYVFCLGGLRCRGTLVYVWDTETPPTIEDTPPPAGPSDPPPERPPTLPPDDRATFPAPAPPVTPDLTEPPAPPLTPPPAAPVTVPRNPDLAALTDTELDDAFARAAAAEDDAQLTAVTDELDRRGAADPARVDNPDVDEAELWASIEATDVDTYLEEELAQAEAFEAEAALDEAITTTTGPGRRIDRVRTDYDADTYRRMIDAEAETRGQLIRRDRLEEWRAKGYTTTDLFVGPARVSYYYASEELRAYWLTAPRVTFDEYAVKAGIRDAKTLKRAEAAARARADAERLAEERADVKAARKAAAARRAADRRLNTPAAQLERDQRRLERARKAAEREARRLGTDPAPPPATSTP